MNFLRWASAFAFTQIVEVPIYRHGLRVSFARAFGASAITHPIVWFAVVESGVHASWTTRVVCGEAFAVIVEALWFASVRGLRAAFFWSLVANGVSFALGLISYRIFGG
jgi:hypothetical protein